MIEETVQLSHTAKEVDDGIERSITNSSDINNIQVDLETVLRDPVGSDAIYGRMKQGDTYSWQPITGNNIGDIPANKVRYSEAIDWSGGLGKQVYDLGTAVSRCVRDITESASTTNIYARQYNGSSRVWTNISNRLPIGIDFSLDPLLDLDSYCPTSKTVKEFVNNELKFFNITTDHITYDPAPRRYNYYTQDSGASNCTGKFIQCPMAEMRNDKLVSVSLTRANNTDWQSGVVTFMLLLKKVGESWIKVATSDSTTTSSTEMVTTYNFTSRPRLSFSDKFYLMISRSTELPHDIADWFNIRLSANPAGSDHSWAGSGIYFNTDGRIHEEWSPRISLTTEHSEPFLFPGVVTGTYSEFGVQHTLLSEVHNGVLDNIAENGGFAEGYMTYAKGIASHAEGLGRKNNPRIDRSGASYFSGAIGNFSHCEGGSYTDLGSGVVYVTNSALGEGSHAEGGGTWAYGKYSHAEGGSAEAVGEGSHAEGYGSYAGGNYSHAEGRSTSAIAPYSHAEGVFNHATQNTIHSVGIGSISTQGYPDSKSAHEIMMNGDHFVYGIGGYDGTNTDTAETLQDIVNNADTLIKIFQNSDNMRYLINRTRLDDEFDDILLKAKKQSYAIKNDDSSQSFADALSLFRHNSTEKDIKSVVYSGDTSNYMSLTTNKRANSLDRLFYRDSNTVSSNYAYSALIKELTYLDCSAATSMCSTFECSMMTRIEKILPTISMTGATGLFYFENNKTIDGRTITDNLVYFAGMDCSSLTEYCNFRPGWSGNWHPLVDAFKNRTKITNLPIFRNLQISIRDGGAKYGSDYNNAASNTQFYLISSILGPNDTRTESEKIQNIIDFFDSLGEAQLRLVNPTTGNYDTNGVGVISFHPDVYDRIKNYVNENKSARMALKYAMTKKNWRFFKNIDQSTREYLNFE